MLCSGVRRDVGFTERVGSNQGVNLSGRNGGMSEKLLHHTNIRTTCEQMSRKRVTEGVWRKLNIKLCPLPCFADDEPGHLP